MKPATCGLAVLLALLGVVWPRSAHAQVAPLYMQVVAHEDDDFLFMNPDLGNQIASGFATVTVYLTTGAPGGTDPNTPPTLTREQFTRARQRGVQAAYAQMAGVSNQWTRSLPAPDGSHLVEMYTLVGAPQIRLIFVDLPEAWDPTHYFTLNDLFDDPSYVAQTVVPECSITEDCFYNPPPLQNYDRAGLLAVLAGLLSTYQPIVVRTLDPQAFTGGILQNDNPDHIHVARFVDVALAGYHGPYGTRRYTVTHYKGYSFLAYPKNLGPADQEEKRATADTYRPYDPNYTANADAYNGYYLVEWERYPASTTWLERTGDGRLVAATVQDRRVLTWHESAPGGAWVGPVFANSDVPLSPHLALIRRSDGRLQLFALRLPLERENWYDDQSQPPQQVVTAVQTAPAGVIRFGAWTVVGNPDTFCTSLCQYVGPPTAAIDGTGRTFVFAKDSTGHVAVAFSNGGPWTPFASMGGEDIVDGIAAITRDDGRIEVFATGRSSQVQHFVQQTGTTSFVRDAPFSTAFYSAASAPTATKNADGRLEIFYREQDTARGLTVYETAGGAWAGPVVLYGDAGVGPIAALRRGATGHIMLFERNVWSGISSTWQQAPNDVFYLQWQIFGGYLEEYPSAANDASGRAVLAVKGGDGRLYERRESSGIGSFAGWTPIECAAADGDADGICDPADVCLHVSNPGQEDADASGVGNACECGDVDLSNTVGTTDVARLREHLAAIASLTPSGVARCSVVGLAADCDVRDVTVLRRSLAVPALLPGIASVCAAANP